MIASHYAEPVHRRLVADALLYAKPSDDVEASLQLQAGDDFLMLDDSLGWAWGYAGNDRRVGYVRSKVLTEH